jgi:hypothetical protein
MEAVSTSKTSVSIYQTTRRNIPEGSHLQSTDHLLAQLRDQKKKKQILSLCFIDKLNKKEIVTG